MNINLVFPELYLPLPMNLAISIVIPSCKFHHSIQYQSVYVLGHPSQKKEEACVTISSLLGVTSLNFTSYGGALASVSENRA
jgi:hypothetical protein